VVDTHENAKIAARRVHVEKGLILCQQFQSKSLSTKKKENFQQKKTILRVDPHMDILKTI